MSIIGIVAVARNFAIGKGGKLPWHYSSDLKFFKNTTSGNAIVMGYNTWLSIGKPLPNRLNIVVSRSRTIDEFPEVKIVRSATEAIDVSKDVGGDLYVIGGAETYKLFAGFIDRWLVTEIPDEVPEADAYMPPDFLREFSLSKETALEDGLIVKSYKRNG